MGYFNCFNSNVIRVMLVSISFMFDIYDVETHWGRLSLEQNWEILKAYFQRVEASTQTVRSLRKSKAIS